MGPMGSISYVLYVSRSAVLLSLKLLYYAGVEAVAAADVAIWITVHAPVSEMKGLRVSWPAPGTPRLAASRRVSPRLAAGVGRCVTMTFPKSTRHAAN